MSDMMVYFLGMVTSALLYLVLRWIRHCASPVSSPESVPQQISSSEHFRIAIKKCFQMKLDFPINSDLRRTDILDPPFSKKRSLPKRKPKSSRTSLAVIYEQEHISKPPMPPTLLLTETDLWIEHSHTYEFQDGAMRLIEHCPIIFTHLRELFGMKDLTRHLESPLTLMKSEGKSKSLFLKTKSQKYLFKTLRRSEPENLKKMLKSYWNHMKKYPDSFLPKFLGLFTFHWSGSEGNLDELGHEFTVVLFPNIFPKSGVDEQYDFKGALVGRQKDPLAKTMKEMDFLNELDNGRRGKFKIGDLKKSKLMKQLDLDLTLLSTFGYMDYSLLIGVRKKSHEIVDMPCESTAEVKLFDRILKAMASIEQHLTSRTSEHVPLLPDRSMSSSVSDEIRRLSCDLERYADTLDSHEPLTSINGHESYYIGIIDILQGFGVKKWIERGMKQPSFLMKRPPSDPAHESMNVRQYLNQWSVEEPRLYRQRLLAFADFLFEK